MPAIMKQPVPDVVRHGSHSEESGAGISRMGIREGCAGRGNVFLD